jgi:glycosyltransferase involved in cell wall biosynthesis
VTRPAVLYVSYDGMLEALGESQGLSYLIRLAREYDVTLMSYEKREDLRDTARVRRLEAITRGAGIRWIRLRYHRRPSLPATLLDVLAGVAVGWRVVRRHGVRLVHARGYVPALLGLALKRLARTSLLFDMRGFFADERVDAGQWTTRSLAYRLAKRCERRFFENADAIVSLTEAGVESFAGLGYRVAPRTRIAVIPTCTDLARFTPGPRDETLAARLGLGDGLVAGCVGTLSGWYLRESMLRYLALLLEATPSARALVVTREDHDALRADALRAGVPAGRLVVARAAFADMPAYVRLMSVGVFFIRPCFSKRASAATKLGEFLATGVPVVINDGVGDSGRIVRDTDAGLVLDRLDAATMAASIPAVGRLVGRDDVRARCRAAAEKWFDVEDGAGRYADLYAALAGGGAR